MPEHIKNAANVQYGRHGRCNMNREQAIELRITKDKFFVFESRLEEILEYKVDGINFIESPMKGESDVRVSGDCNVTKAQRYFQPKEIFGTRIEALEQFAQKLQFDSDKALRKRAAITQQIADIKKEDERYG
jgi:hypothetical protein